MVVNSFGRSLDRDIYELSYKISNEQELKTFIEYRGIPYDYRFLSYIKRNIPYMDSESLDKYIEFLPMDCHTISRIISYIEDYKEPNKAHTRGLYTTIRVVNGLTIIFWPDQPTDEPPANYSDKYQRAIMFARRLLNNTIPAPQEMERLPGIPGRPRTEKFRIGKRVLLQTEEKWLKGEDISIQNLLLNNGYPIEEVKLIVGYYIQNRSYQSLAETRNTNKQNIQYTLDRLIIKIAISLFIDYHEDSEIIELWKDVERTHQNFLKNRGKRLVETLPSV